MNHSLKKYPVLFTAGPMQVSERVRMAVSAPNLMHRDPAFTGMLGGIQKKLLKVFELNDEYFSCIFTATGHGVNEAMIVPFVLNHTPLFVTNGSWGDNLIEIAHRYKKNLNILRCPDDKRIETGLVDEYLKSYKAIDTLIVVHQETRTGILNPIDKIAGIAKKHKCKLIVDAMSSIVVEQTDFQKLGVSFFSCGSTKGLRSLPGLGVVCGKIKEFEKLKNYKRGPYYFDLYEEYLLQKNKKSTRFAQSTPLFAALNESLSEILEEGFLERRAMVQKRMIDFRKWASSIGLRPVCAESELGNTLTTYLLPDGLTYVKFSAYLKKWGIYILYGDRIFNNQFQITFMGANTEHEIKLLKSAILKILQNKRSRSR